MRLGYTEFAFAYAFTENLIRASATGPVSAPFFPNLIQEAQLGYDVKIQLPACPLFFQYKLPELMIRRSANEISRWLLRAIGIPFFRMPLMRRDLSRQHQLLIDLGRCFPDAVYYAAPLMSGIEYFNDAYSTAQVHQRSVLFSPATIGPLRDDKQHVVAYDGSHAWLCSEPQVISFSDFASVVEATGRLFQYQRYRSLEGSAKYIRQEIARLAPPQIRASEDAIRQRVRDRNIAFADGVAARSPTMDAVEELLVSREIARVGLGVDMVIAQPRVQRA